jgi:hypothetical protein
VSGEQHQHNSFVGAGEASGLECRQGGSVHSVALLFSVLNWNRRAGVDRCWYAPSLGPRPVLARPSHFNTENGRATEDTELSCELISRGSLHPRQNMHDAAGEFRVMAGEQHQHDVFAVAVGPSREVCWQGSFVSSVPPSYSVLNCNVRAETGRARGVRAHQQASAPAQPFHFITENRRATGGTEHSCELISRGSLHPRQNMHDVA